MFDAVVHCGTMKVVMKKPRAFKRDAYLGIRMPDEDKRRLAEGARKKRRDVSNLALEFIVDGLNRMENETRLIAR
jgi:hypothetical protein